MRTFPVLALILVGVLASCDGGSSTAEALGSGNPREQFGAFVRAERWYLHYRLPNVNEGIHKRYEVLLPLLEAGDLHVVKAFAKAYMRGRGPLGGPQSFEKSFELYSKAAEMGDPVSMTALGYMYARGTAVERDSATALAWFEKSYELSAGRGAAMGISTLYSHGYGPGNIQKSERKAKQWEEKARRATQARFESGGVAEVKKRLRAERTRGVEDGESVLRRFFDAEFEAIRARADGGAREALTKLGSIKLGKDPFWRGYRSEVFDPVEGIALLEEAYALENDARRKRRLARSIAGYYRSVREIKDPDKAEYWGTRS